MVVTFFFGDPGFFKHHFTRTVYDWCHGVNGVSVTVIENYFIHCTPLVSKKSKRRYSINSM